MISSLNKYETIAMTPKTAKVACKRRLYSSAP